MSYSITQRFRQPRTGSMPSIEQNSTGLAFTGRIASWSASHRWMVIAASVMVIVLAMLSLSFLETKILDYRGEGESAVGAKLVEDGFEFNSAPTEQLVFSNPFINVQTPDYRSTVQSLATQLRELPEIESVTTYYDSSDPALVSDDDHVTIAQVVIAGGFDDADEKIEAVLNTVYAADAAAPDFEISIAGATSIQFELEKIDEEDFGRMIIITMILALTFMLFAFRGVVAATIPLVLAVGSIFTALGVAAAVSQIYPMVDFLAQVVLLMGMAVGVDYSLFIVSRYRSERQAGKNKLDAITTASNTTGRAVFYAGVTVLLSLAGLAFTQSPIFISMAIGIIIVVLLAMTASLTLLPAMLAVLGDKVDALRLPFIGRTGGNGGGVWGKLTDKVLGRPVVLATAAVALLIALAIPAFSLNMGISQGSDAFNDAVDGKRALQLLEENFAFGLASPAFVIVEDSNVHSEAVPGSVANLITALSADNAFVPPYNVTANQDGNLLYVEVPLAADVDEDEAANTIRHLRQDIIPVAFAGSFAETYVSGLTAGSVDITNTMTTTAPYVFGFVLGLAFLLLLVMFRSVVIPFKAIVLNLFSVGAAYGVMVMVFQWGWGISILGSSPTGVIEPWLPLFLFAILFGLSMDYHMLILNRIKEAYDQGLSNEESVSQGIKLTAGQITSAAAIMVGVFGTFALGRQIGIQQFGLGLAVAVLIDATIIRSVLLPASMKLLGDRNWCLPSWLEWLPNINSSESEQPEQAITQAIPATSGD